MKNNKNGSVNIFILLTVFFILSLYTVSTKMKKELSSNLIKYAKIIKCNEYQTNVYENYIKQISRINNAIRISSLIPQVQTNPLGKFFSKKLLAALQDICYLNYIRLTIANPFCKKNELIDFYQSSPYKRNALTFKRSKLGTVTKETSEWIKRFYFPKQKILIETNWELSFLGDTTHRSKLIDVEDFSKLNYLSIYSL